jgi:isocitrate/isopropylmalate dehydrogenase
MPRSRKQYPDIAFNELYVDAASMRLIKEPQIFDVLCTCNMFGDILSDEAAQLIGGLGMAPGANIGDNFGLLNPSMAPHQTAQENTPQTHLHDIVCKDDAGLAGRKIR